MAKDKKIDFSQIDKKILSLKPQLIKRIREAIEKEGKLNNYLIVWDQLQKIASLVIVKILKEAFPEAEFTISKSKSTYPDVKMELEGFKVAIDIKSNESSKEPWYDIARLDTIIESRINKFNEEYDLVIKYDSETNKLLKIFFETMRETVGIREECRGVKYRPYDGKVRPKSWADFDNGVVYWKTKDAFLKGIEISKKYRMKELIKEHWKNLTEEERQEYRDSFA